jgi:hypothetical protein
MAGRSMWQMKPIYFMTRNEREREREREREKGAKIPISPSRICHQ